MSFVLIAVLVTGCSSLPSVNSEKYAFPQGAYIGDLKARPYTVLGQVRAREDYQTLDPSHDEDYLCRNYFNKGARDLMKMARDRDADAVIQIKSVTFNADGTVQTYDSPQCADDGQNGQVLLQGVAVKWSEAPAKAVVLKAPSSRRYRGLLLEKQRDGMDGGIRMMENPLKIVLYTMNRKVLDQVAADAPDSWLTAEFLRSPKLRTILVNSEEKGAARGDVRTRLLALGQGKLSLVAAEDSSTRKSEPMILVQGQKSDWRLSPTQPRDILEVSASAGGVTYVRYHFNMDGGGWTRFSRTLKGEWDASQPFPSESEFPALNYSSK